MRSRYRSAIPKSKLQPWSDYNDRSCSGITCTSCSWSANRYLDYQAKNNDVEKALNALLDGDDVTKELEGMTWDDSLHSADREGNRDANQNLRPLGTSAAPTRGPSPAGSYRHPANKDEEDADLAQAMALSQQQETGIAKPDGSEQKLGNGSKYFGPANRSEYDQNSWAMVPLKADTSEIVPDLDAEHRKYVPGEPRFLKYMPSGDYLQNFLTICHSIPAAREALLMRNHVQPSYGQEEDWWRGHAIAMPKVVHVADGSPAQPDTDRQDELLAETQRLMAFLDCSQRLYASGALSQTDAIKYAQPASTRSRTILEFYLREWVAAASTKSGHEGDLSHLFTTTVGTTDPQGMDSPYMHLVDLPVNTTGEAKSDLSEMLDDLLWDTNPEGSTSDNFLSQPAEVLVMRAYRQQASAGTPIRLEVPSQFYIDKYLEQNISASRDVRSQIAGHKKRVTKIEAVEAKLTSMKHPSKHEQIDAKTLLQYTAGHFSGHNKQEADKANNGNMNVVNGEIDTRPEHYPEIAKKLDKVIASIDDKLAQLNLTKEKTRKAISDMSKASFAEVGDGHRYTLCGVATKPNITYVLRPIEEQDEDQDMLLEREEDDTPAGMQWWRIEYEVSGSKTTINRMKSPDYDVLRAVELEHSSALLVYASDEACSPARYNPSLPRQLADFVKDDNALFEAELRDNAGHRALPSFNLMDDDVRPSIEGRTSMDSTRGAQGGDTPPYYDDDGFIGAQHHEYGLGPDIKSGTRMQEDDAPVTEIKLDEPEDEGIEMVEKGDAEPFMRGTVGGDAVMEDASQDDGLGGHGDTGGMRIAKDAGKPKK